MLTPEEERLFDTDVMEHRTRFRVLVIYDIVDNKRRYRFVKFISSFGFRVQKSAFEGWLDRLLYKRLCNEIPSKITSQDNVRVYRLNGNADVKTWGVNTDVSQNDVMIL